MISIYTHTHNPFKKEFWKYVAKKILKKYSGPDAVLDSLTRGLVELGIPFEVNPFTPKYNIIHVISGVEVLQEFVEKKKKGIIKRLVVGPTTVQTPYDKNNVIQDPAIDLHLFPSEWPRNWFLSLVPELKDKIKIWPAGVKIPKEGSKKENILIFKKTVPDKIYENVLSTLDANNIPYDIIVYGKYSRQQYLEKLFHAKALIYLQVSESQGLALQEAWSYDIPTFVWQNKDWKFNSYSWTDPKLAAPYLTEDTGEFFTLDSFDKVVDTIKNNIYNFKPREYCIKNLSDKRSTEIYLEIIKNNIT